MKNAFGLGVAIRRRAGVGDMGQDCAVVEGMVGPVYLCACVCIWGGGSFSKSYSMLTDKCSFRIILLQFRL